MLEIKGFPELIGIIELPELPELMMTPIMLGLDAEFAYKNGDDLTRYLLDKTPLKNNKKFVTITSTIQYLTPGFSAARSVVQPEGDWHIDGASFDSEDVNYLLLSDSESNTEFNSEPMLVDMQYSDKQAAIEYINRNNLGLIPQVLPGNRMAIYGSRNAYRERKILKPTFRYMWKVAESDDIRPMEISDLSFRTSYVYKYRIPFPNIKQEGKEVIIY